MDSFIAGGIDYGVIVFIIIAIVSSLLQKKKKPAWTKRKRNAKESSNSFFTRSIVKPEPQKPASSGTGTMTKKGEAPSFEDIFETLFDDKPKPVQPSISTPVPLEIRPQKRTFVESSLDSKPVDTGISRFQQQTSTLSGTDKKQEEIWDKEPYKTTQLRDIAYKQKDVAVDLKDVNIDLMDVDVVLTDIGDSGITTESAGRARNAIDALSTFQRAIIISEIFGAPVHFRRGPAPAAHHLLGRDGK